MWYDLKKLLWQDELNPRVCCAFGNVLNLAIGDSMSCISKWYKIFIIIVLQKMKGARLYRLLDNIIIFIFSKSTLGYFVIDFRTSRFGQFICSFSTIFQYLQPKSWPYSVEIRPNICRIFFNLCQIQSIYTEIIFIEDDILKHPIFPRIIMMNMIIHPMIILMDFGNLKWIFPIFFFCNESYIYLNIALGYR